MRIALLALLALGFATPALLHAPVALAQDGGSGNDGDSGDSGGGDSGGSGDADGGADGTSDPGTVNNSLDTNPSGGGDIFCFLDPSTCPPSGPADGGLGGVSGGTSDWTGTGAIFPYAAGGTGFFQIQPCLAGSAGTAGRALNADSTFVAVWGSCRR